MARCTASVIRFVSTARAGSPTDHSSRIRSVVDAATGSGRPVVIVTDGEIDEPELLPSLPRGSRTIVIPRKEHPDVGVSALDAPRALLAGEAPGHRASRQWSVAPQAAPLLTCRAYCASDDVVLDSIN